MTRWILAAACLTAAAPAQQFQELPVKSYLPATAGFPTLAVFDADADGDADLMNGGTVTGSPIGQLYLNDGEAVFTEADPTSLPPPSVRTRALAAADVDGDGDLDVVLGNAAEQNRLLVNDGAGHFTDATAGRLPADNDSTQAVAWGDVDGDGDRDLVIGNDDNEQNRLYVNDGTGRFTDVTATQMPPDVQDTAALALGDVDGDGDLDLVAGNRSDGGTQTNRLYLNDGAGRFTDGTATRLPADIGWTRDLALGDVDGDGDLDLAVANGTLTSRSANELYINDGTGAFTLAPPAQMPAPQEESDGVAMVDVDGDLDLDLVIANQYLPSRLLRNDGTGTFADASSQLPPLTSYVLAATDLDADGDADLVLSSGLCLNDGAGTFTDVTSYPRLPLSKSSALASADVDGDGDPDLAIGDRELFPYPTALRVRLDLNDGTGVFADVTSQRMPGRPCWTASLAFDDVDHDGDADLLVGNAAPIASDQQNRLYLNDGQGTFIDATDLLPLDQDDTLAMVVGDVDADGDDDVILGNSGTQNRLYLNDGSGRFRDGTAARMPTDSGPTAALALGDVDGDGDLDVVVGNDGTQDRLYMNDGTGRFADVTASQMPADEAKTTALVLGDVDGDGDPDLVLGRQGRVSLYLGDGSGRFTDRSMQMPGVGGLSARALALVDVDDDGDLDLAVGTRIGSSGEGDDLLLLNDGHGVFADATASRIQSQKGQASSLLAVDVDRDGDPDLIYGSESYPDRLLVNLHRQLDAPTRPFPSHVHRLTVYGEPGYATGPRLADVVIGLGLLPSPLPVPGLGTFFVAPPLVVLPPFSIAASQGSSTLAIPIPTSRAFVGLPVVAQAAVVDGAGLHLTGYTFDPIAR